MPDLIKWGSITAAGDVTTTALVNNTSSATRAAIVGLSNVLVGTTGTWTDLNNVDATRSLFLRADGTALNRPLTTSPFLVIHQYYAPTAAVQIAMAYGQNRVFTRRKQSDTWSDWLELATTAYVDEKTRYSAQAYKSVHQEGSSWVWDGRGSTAATHYLVHDPVTGRLFAATEAIPRPSASSTSPYLDW